MDLEYDVAGRLTAVENALGERIEYTLDAVGNRTQSVIDGVTTAYTYDNNNRLTQYQEANQRAKEIPQVFTRATPKGLARKKTYRDSVPYPWVDCSPNDKHSQSHTENRNEGPNTAPYIHFAASKLQYLVAKENMPELENLEEIVDEQEKSHSDDVEISSAALESLKELGITDEGEMAALESQSTKNETESSSPTESSDDVEISSAALESLKELGITR